MRLRNLLSEDVVKGLVEMKKAKRDIAFMKDTAIALVRESLLPYADRLDLDNLVIEDYRVNRFPNLGDWSSFTVDVTNTNFTMFGECRYLNKLNVYVDIHERTNNHYEWIDHKLVTNNTYTYEVSIRVHDSFTFDKDTANKCYVPCISRNIAI